MKDIKEAADRRLADMTFTEDMKRKVRRAAPARRGVKRRVLVGAAIAVATLAAFTTVAFATGLIDSIFGNTGVQEYGMEAKYEKLEEASKVSTEQAADGSEIFTQSYYDGQQLILGLAYDNTKYQRMGGVLINGEEPDPPDESTSYDSGTTIEMLQFSTPLPEAARGRESVEVKIRLGLLDGSAEYFRYDENGNALPATRADYEKQYAATPQGATAYAIGDATAVFVKPTQFTYATLTVQKSEAGEARVYTGSLFANEYSAAVSVIASSVNTKLNITLTGLSGGLYDALSGEINDEARDDSYISEFKVLCDGEELAGFGTNQRIYSQDDGSVIKADYEAELPILPEGAKEITVTPAYADGRDSSAETVVIALTQN